MNTSGIYRRVRDMDVECECGWEGWVTLTEDTEDLTAWWTCPGCVQKHDLIITDERGMSQVLFTITICCLAAAVFLLMGGQWLPAIGTLAVLTIIHGVAKGDTKRNETK